MEKNSCSKRPQTCQPLTIKMGYLFGTLGWCNNALSVKKYEMAAPRTVSDFKRPCPFPLFVYSLWQLFPLNQNFLNTCNSITSSKSCLWHEEESIVLWSMFSDRGKTWRRSIWRGKLYIAYFLLNLNILTKCIFFFTLQGLNFLSVCENQI